MKLNGPTFADVIDLYRDDPTIHACLTLYRLGHYDREQSLIAMVLNLHEACERLKEKLYDDIATRTFTVLVKAEEIDRLARIINQ